MGSKLYRHFRSDLVRILSTHHSARMPLVLLRVLLLTNGIQNSMASGLEMAVGRRLCPCHAGLDFAGTLVFSVHPRFARAGALVSELVL